HGKGTYTYADGRKYDGEFKNDTVHGKGTCTYAGGDKYVGEFYRDNRNGIGTYTYADGRKYEGEWKEGTPNGIGTTTYPDGSVENGTWRYGLFTGMKPDKIKDQNESKAKKHMKSDKEALTIEDELLKLKELYEKDLITEEVYKAQQISILESDK
ncbi:hypothetical protein OAJ38_03500, partial [Rhodobiaceae bacterium]|nr:hypothetical protein [Rhodobiaceae bacterium]